MNRILFKLIAQRIGLALISLLAVSAMVFAITFALNYLGDTGKEPAKIAPIKVARPPAATQITISIEKPMSINWGETRPVWIV